ncbi:MAG: ABC transporter permease subunit, partial [Anaerolineales bacterium]
MTSSKEPLADVRHWLQRGLLAGRIGDYDEARHCFQAARDLDPDSLTALLWLAWLAPRRRERLALFCRVLELDPCNEHAQAGIEWLGSHPPRGDGRVADSLRQTGAAIEGGKPAQVRLAPVVSPFRRGQALIGIAALTGRRLAFGALVLITTIFLTHMGFALAQGLTLYPAASSCRPLSRSCKFTLNQALTLFPALTSSVSKTAVYLARLAQGDLGLSRPGTLTLRSVPVAEVLPPALSKSLGLMFVSLLIATLVGVVLGLWAARRRHSNWSLPILLSSITGISVPSFFAALLLQLAMVRWAHAFGGPLLPLVGFGWDQHLILPALVLAARPVAQIARVTFISVGEILDQDFIRTAHGKGLSPGYVLSRHVVRNAAIPILTTVGLSLRFSLSSLPVVEFLFHWAGVGYTLLKAISHLDENVTVALLLCLSIFFILINLVLEASYRLIDPRLQEHPAYVRRGERGNPVELVQAALADLGDWIAHNPLSEWLRRRQSAPSPNPFQAVLARNGINVAPADYRSERQRAWLLGTLGNLPFVTGGVLAAALTIIFVFGPQLAPH